MKLRGRARTAALAAALALTASLGPLAGSAAAEPPPAVDAQAWVLVNASSDDVLAAHDASRELSIASATKLMTAYVALRELPLSRRVAAPAYQPTDVESVLGLQAGERIAVRDLVYGLILASANDGAVALAEASAGSVDAFVAEMNRTAGSLGLEDTNFANPVGFDEPGNRSSARDLATLTRALLSQPFFRRVADTETRTIHTDRRALSIETRNALLTRVGWLDGVKTGFTLDAGHVLVGSGTRRGATLISVVLGEPSEAARDRDTLKLLRYGFARLPPEPPASEGELTAQPQPGTGEAPARDSGPPAWVALAALAIVILIGVAFLRRARAVSSEKQ